MTLDLNKVYREHSDDELKEILIEWTKRCETAPGWSSAYFSATQIETVCREAKRRGLRGFENRHPITLEG
jgi:hypothetical protein